MSAGTSRPLDDRPAVGHLVVGFGVFLAALWMQHGETLAGLSAAAARNLATSQALAAGEGFRLAHLPGAPFPEGVGPLYPLLLSVVWRIWPAFPANLVLMGIVDALLLGVGAGILAVYTRRLRIPWWAGYAAAAIGCLSAATLSATVARTGVPLLLAGFGGSLLVAERVHAPRDALLAGVLAGLCGLVEPRAFALVIIVAGLLWLGRRSRLAGISAVPGVVLFAAWLWWTRAAEAVPTAPEWSSGPPSFLGVNGLGGLTEIAVAPLPVWLGTVVGAAVALVAVWGLIEGGTARMFGAAVAGTMPALSIGADHGAAALIPWLAVAFVVGCVRMWGRLRAVRGPVAAFGIAVAGLSAVAVIGRLAGGVATDADRERSAAIGPLARSIGRELPDDAMIASAAADAIALHSGRRTIRLGVSASDESPAALCRLGVSHVAALRVSSVDEAAVDVLMRNGRLVPLFVMTNGPALYRLTCD